MMGDGAVTGADAAGAAVAGAARGRRAGAGAARGLPARVPRRRAPERRRVPLGGAAPGRCGASGAGALAASAARDRAPVRAAVSGAHLAVVLEDRPPGLVDGIRVGEVLLVHLVDEPFIGSVLARRRLVGTRPGQLARHSLSPTLSIDAGFLCRRSAVRARASCPITHTSLNPSRGPGRRRRGGSVGRMEFYRTTPSHDLTYSDVFLVPSRSGVTSRLDVSLAPDDGSGASVPIVSANMNSITGPRLAATLARRGGLGVLPQDLHLQDLDEAIRWVKAQSPRFDTAARLQPRRHRRRCARGAAAGRRATASCCTMRAASTSDASPPSASATALPDARLGDLVHGGLASLDADDVDSPRRAFDLMVDAGLEFAPVLRARPGRRHAQPAQRAARHDLRAERRRVRPPPGRRRGRHQRRRRRQGAGARRPPASTCS